MLHQRYATASEEAHSYLRILRFLWFVSLLSAAAPNDAGTLSPLSPSALPIACGYDIDGSLEEGVTASTTHSAATAADTNYDNLATHEEDWRRSLPPGLRDDRGAPLHRIVMDEGGVVLYLLGSSHVSRASCDDARLLMEHVRPDALFVELCSQRVGLLLDPPSESDDQHGHNDKDHDEMTPLSHRGSVMFAKIQADYAKKLNVTIGGEFRQAFQSALTQQRQFWESRESPVSMAYDNYFAANCNSPFGSGTHPRGDRPCAVILGDRPVRITLLRAWESLGPFGKFKLMLALLWSSVRKPSEKELREWMESILNDRTGKNDLLSKAMEELGRAFPTLKRVIIEERDSFMVAKLRQTAEALTHSTVQGGEKVIVALVGAGHCPGMLEKLMQNDALCNEEDTKSILASLDSRPETVLPGLLQTKKRKIGNDADMSSMVSDIVQFDYSYVLQSELQ